jgi:tripartite-type tricarboxylate transporter receptor subunit TctC
MRSTIQKSIVLAMALILGCTFLFAGGAGEEGARPGGEFPNRPIQYIVPWGPDNESVAMARVIAAEMSEILGVDIVVQAMPGGSGTVGLNHVLQQPADGYTMLDAWVAPLIFAVLNRPDLGYTYEDFAPIGHTTFMPFSLVVRADDERFKTFDDFVEHGQANPGMRYNATGAISVPHAAMATFLDMADIEAQGVPYPGLGGGIADLLGGTLDFSLGNPWVVNTYGEETRTLAFFLEERHPWYPDIPVAAEFGYPVSGIGWDSLAVRADTPEPVLRVLREAYEQVVTDPDMIARMEELGFWLNYMSAEETYEFWEDENQSLRSGVEILQRKAQ